MAFQAVGQTKSPKPDFILTGNIRGKDTGIIILWYPDTNYRWTRDTTNIKDGRFEFRGFIREPSFAHLIGSKKDGNYNDFYLEIGKQQIDLVENEFSDFKMSGSFSQNQADSFKSKLQAIEEKYSEWISEYKRLNDQLKTVKDSGTLLSLHKKIAVVTERNDPIYMEMLQERLSFILQHPDSYVSPVELYSILTNGRQIKTDLADSIYNLFSDRTRKSMFGKRVQDEINNRTIGTAAADFSAKEINGNNISLSAFQNKYVLIDFWASWCVPCLEQIPELKGLQEKYNSKGLEIVCISVDTDSQNWEEAIKKYQTQNFHHVLANNDITEKYSNTKQPIPSQILVNKNGIVIWNSFDVIKGLREILENEFGY